MSVCAPLLFRSTSPGFGVVLSSRSSAKCAAYASVSAQNSLRSASVAALIASSPCARLRAQSAAGPPQMRHLRGTVLLSFTPSLFSTSKSYSLAAGKASSMRSHAALTSPASARRSSSASVPVFRSKTRRSIPSKPSRSKRSSPRSKSSRVFAVRFTSPAIFSDSETRQHEASAV